ncbi:unnamed protein product [Rodentolepis nana]|uniref:Ovule protein n=1 Tax=Rodentolepis nana TaxID=102285 RepID=A0A0R3TRF3_RODNA|nr:unnamed protein product [Rodentolepis nana]
MRARPGKKAEEGYARADLTPALLLSFIVSSKLPTHSTEQIIVSSGQSLVNLPAFESPTHSKSSSSSSTSITPPPRVKDSNLPRQIPVKLDV